MHLRPRLLTVAALLFLAPCASARIGETLEQCTARYGKPSPKKIPNSVVFEKNGIAIIAVFLNDKVASLTFMKIERTSLGDSKPLSATEIEALLESNKGESKWTKVDSTRILTQDWIRDDGACKALYNENKNYLGIVTEEFAAKVSNEKSEKEKSNLEGF